VSSWDEWRVAIVSQTWHFWAFAAGVGISATILLIVGLSILNGRRQSLQYLTPEEKVEHTA
jgi:hypothetical protein